MTAIFNELEPYAARWLVNLADAGHIARGTVDTRSIREVQPDDIRHATQFHAFAGIGVWSHALRLAGWPDDRPVWTGSCPCQPFSVAGRGKGADDERHLWPEWFRLIRECRPPVVFGEQVASPDGLAWLDAVRADLEGAGYAFGASDICAAGIGAPHIRQRLYFVGIRLADPNAAGRVELGRGGVREDGHASQRHDADGRGAARGLADHRSEGRRQVGADVRGRVEGGRAEGVDERPLHGGALGAQRMGSPIREGLEGHAGHGDALDEPGRLGTSPHGPTPTSGFWSNPGWVLCRDGKARPVEPGTFPLAHGATQRVGRLRAYGNAIVSEVAATFIKAVMEAA